MKRIWRMAGVGLLVVSVGSQAMADERDNSPGLGRGPQGQHERGPEGGPRPEHNLPIQGRPDAVRQTQEPRQGYYRDIPRRPDDNRHWEPAALVRVRVTIAPVITAGQAALTGMATAGALARNIALVMSSTVFPTAITACLTVARTTFSPVATGIAPKARATWW